MCFDICLHTGNYHHHQASEYIHHPRKFPQPAVTSPSCCSPCPIFKQQVSVCIDEFAFPRVFYKRKHTLLVWFFSLNIIILRFIHATACNDRSHLFTIWTYVICAALFGFPQVWVITNKVALNIPTQVSAWKCVSFSHRCKPRRGMAALSLKVEDGPSVHLFFLN